MKITGFIKIISVDVNAVIKTKMKPLIILVDLMDKQGKFKIKRFSNKNI